jgi:hypothetical protein
MKYGNVTRNEDKGKNRIIPDKEIIEMAVNRRVRMKQLNL